MEFPRVPCQLGSVPTGTPSAAPWGISPRALAGQWTVRTGVRGLQGVHSAAGKCPCQDQLTEIGCGDSRGQRCLPQWPSQNEMLLDCAVRAVAGCFLAPSRCGRSEPEPMRVVRLGQPAPGYGLVSSSPGARAPLPVPAQMLLLRRAPGTLTDCALTSLICPPSWTL